MNAQEFIRYETSIYVDVEIDKYSLNASVLVFAVNNHLKMLAGIFDNDFLSPSTASTNVAALAELIKLFLYICEWTCHCSSPICEDKVNHL